MFILSNYFRNYSSFLRKETPAFAEGEAEPFSSFKPGGSAFNHARLAANCCVALGKAHCAAVHTEGDLLLMSAYSRGSVPVERQLAQMLFEVPHHMKVGGPGGEAGQGEGGGWCPMVDALPNLREDSDADADERHRIDARALATSRNTALAALMEEDIGIYQSTRPNMGGGWRGCAERCTCFWGASLL